MRNRWLHGQGCNEQLSRNDLPVVSGVRPGGRGKSKGDAVLRRLLAADAEPSRLTETLAALSAAPPPGAQPGEVQALAAFRELVAQPAGVVSLAHRRRLRAVALASSVLVVMGGGVAAAAAGALPDSAQSVAKNVLDVVGVHVPSPTTTPSPAPQPTSSRGDSAASTAPATAGPSASASAHANHPPALGSPSPHPSHPAHPWTPPTPGNAGTSRHHGNPTPTATTHPSPGHGKPTAPPATSKRKTPHPHLKRDAVASVTHSNRGAIHS